MIGYSSQAAVRPRTSLPEPAVFGGATGGKIGMWVFLVTDGMGFGAMLAAYAVLRARAAAWPDPYERLAIPLAGGMTLLLIASSLTVLLALASARAGKRGGAAGWLAVTVACGLAFLGGQAYEYHHLLTAASRMGLTTNAFASTFYVVTGFHGAHVLAGVIYLAVLFGRQLGRRKGAVDPNVIQVAALFWHFVDLAWVPIFTFVYLLPAR
jgi:cytochrome c oxidase subunit 3